MARFRWLPALLLLVSPLAVEAKCRSPQRFIVPDSGPLPANPRLHVFVPASMQQKKASPKMSITREDGSTVEHALVEVTSSDAFHVFRVDVKTNGATAIRVGFKGEAKTTYSIDGLYRTELSGTAEITSSAGTSFKWACSSEEAQVLTPSLQAPLYRIEWAESEEAFRAGKRQTVLLPNRVKDLAFPPGTDPYGEPPKPVTEPAELPLGKLGCAGTTHAWQRSIWVGLVAMYPDGTESTPAEPQKLDPPPPPVSKRKY